MHFVFEAKAEGTDWVANWNGHIIDCEINTVIIVTHSGIKSCLAWSVHDALTALYSAIPKADEDFTFEILFI